MKLYSKPSGKNVHSKTDPNSECSKESCAEKGSQNENVPWVFKMCAYSSYFTQEGQML